MQPFRFDIYPQDAELFAEMTASLLRNDHRMCLEADTLTICATAWCAA